MKTRLTPLLLLFATVISVCGDLDAWNNGTNSTINIATAQARGTLAGAEVIATNGITLAGSRITSWPTDTTANWTASGSTNSTLSGNATANSVTLAVGSTSSPTVRFGDADSGFYSSNGRQISFASDGTQYLNLDSDLSLVNGASIRFQNGQTVLIQDSSATLQQGVDAASPVNQTFKAADGSGTDKAGANFTFSGGKSTGTGRGGDVIHQTANSIATGSSANTYSTRRYESAKFVDLSGGVATLIATITCNANTYLGANIIATVFAADSTDRQSLTSRIQLDCVNTNGVVIPTISQVDNTAAVTAGTLACTYTASNWTNAVAIFANSVSSLTETTNRVKWIISDLNSSDAATVTPQ